MAKAASTSGAKPARPVGPLTVYLIGAPEAIAGIKAVERDAKRVLDAQNEAAANGDLIVSKKFVVHTNKRGQAAA